MLTGATTTVASFDEERLTLLQRIQRFLHVYPTTVPFVVLALGLLLGVAVNPARFTTASNISTVLTQVMVTGILGVGQTLVILTAGIDLSVGVIMVISSVVMGRLAVLDGVPTILAFPLGLLCGAAFGLLNGALVTRLKMPPFIVTLGTLSIIGALNTFYSQSETIGMQDIEEKAPFLSMMGNPLAIGGARIMWGTFLMLLVAAVVWYVLNRTAYGRHVYATGDDPEAARLAGIDTDRDPAQRLRCRRPHRRDRRLGADRPRRRHQPDGGREHEPQQHHRRGDRRHKPVRRPRLDHRHPDRRADRRRVPFGGLARRPRRALAGIRHRRADHRRGRPRPVDPEGLQVSVQPILTGRQLVKRYGRVTALDHADFDLYPNEILAVIGDNGAGKSTLIKAICGAVIPDSGEIRLGGEVVHFTSPIAAREAGIETVYQTLALSPALSIADNMFLGREIPAPGVLGTWFRATDRAKMAKFAREKLNELGLMTIQNIHQPVETLSGGQRQGVAVARAAAFAKRLVIMDEPTAALGVKESRRVLELILDVKKRGLPIILISHNMPHVFEVADRIHIHRLGRRLTVVDPKKITMSDAVAMMTGAMAPPVEAEAA